MKPFRSIWGKMLISHLAVILVSTFTLGITMSYLVYSHVVNNKLRELMDKGSAIITLVSPAIASGRRPVDPDLRKLNDLVGATIWIADQSGTVLAGKPPSRWSTRILPEKTADIAALFAGTSQAWVHSSPHQADPSIVVALPVPGTPVPTAIFLHTPITGVNNTVAALDRLLFYSLLAGIAAAVILGYLISRSLTRPIANISQAAGEFAAGNYNSRATVTNDDEIGQLGRTFNHMAASLSLTEQSRREFLANVSHEIKTPVAAIQALAETIIDGLAPTAEQRQRYLGNIVSEARHIDRLIRDLLDLAQLDAGELSIIREPVELAAFLPAELDRHSSLAAAKQLTYKIEQSAPVPPVLADPDRLSQVLSNLISNAIRHSPPSAAIIIGLKCLTNKVQISVQDSGPGIPAGELDHIWDRFYRVDKSRARRDGGTGLGLAITKKLVHAMGGTIDVDSQPGKQTVFFFSLPTAN